MRGYTVRPDQAGLAIPKMQKAKRKRTIRSDKPEAVLQRQCEALLELRGIEYLHIPNSMWATLFAAKSFGTLNECADYLKGWPDLLIMRDGHYLAVELKTKIGKESHAQKTKKRILGGHVCRSFDDFQTTLNQWEEQNAK